MRETSGRALLTQSYRSELLAPSISAFFVALNPQQSAANKPFDFDGDGKADVSVWQDDTTHNWIILKSSNNQTQTQPDWGSTALGDIAVPGDYDGDGKTDCAIWRASEGNWYVIRSSNGTILLKNWGSAGDKPAPGDYDGDGKTDCAVYRPAEGNWYLNQSSDNASILRNWGMPGDEVVPADYDGDGKTDLAVYRPLEGNWYIQKSSTGTLLVQWGGIGDKLVPADYDGDGKADVAVWRPADGNWYVKRSSDGGTTLYGWGEGNLGDIPVPADYDGDGKADITVWRAGEGNWYIVKSSNNSLITSTLGSSSTDLPVPSAYIKTVVPPPNQLPTANAGGPYSAIPAVALQFNGGQSSDPDGQITSYQWSFGDSTSGTGAKPKHIYTTTGTKTVTLTVTDDRGATNIVSVNVNVLSAEQADFANARLDPLNSTGQSGENPLSRNFNWSLPILGLRGRGLDFGLSLIYNSLVWTKAGNYIAYDLDEGYPGPGFRLGFPVIQPKYHNIRTNQDSYMMLMPSGSRVELRQVGATNVYQSADSSYLQLIDNGSLLVRTTDGTQLRYALLGNDYQCTEMKDRNGNFITIGYNNGRLSTTTDTLGRLINFNYDADGYLTSISQQWGQQTHYWARFTYSSPDLSINTSFTNLTAIGPQNNTNVRVLTGVKLDDDSSYGFTYSSYGQIYKITHFAADAHQLAYSSYNMDYPGAQNDCPRFTERRDWAENWNNNQEATTLYAMPANASWTMPNDNASESGLMSQVTTPDGTYYRIYSHASGWDKGLPMLAETYGAAQPGESIALQRWTTTKLTQDDTALAYPLNPRAIESSVGDLNGNQRRTTIGYQAFTLPGGTSCYLPEDVAEYDGASIYRHTQTDYNLSAAYLNQYIIGLVSEQRLYARAGTSMLSSKVSYQYDEAGYVVDQPSLVQHDATYNSNFVQGRGLQTSVQRWDVNHSSDASKSAVSRVGYNIAGAIVFTRDPLWQEGQSGHQVNINYADSFSTGGNRQTFAYPTVITDADGFSSTIKYNYDFGAVTERQTPAPQGFTTGPIQTMEYDAIGRLVRSSNSVNGAYTKWTYPTSQTIVETLTKVNAEDAEDAARSFKVLDGAGRVRATATALPNGNYAAQLFVYDVMGRVVQTSHPTETNASGSAWAAVGDDATTGWVYTAQTYDWKARPLTTTQTADGLTTTSEALYEGCGCVGGEVVITRDEVGRRQRVSYDRFGRAWRTQSLYEQLKSEPLNGAGAVYSTVTNSYNVRDQLTEVYDEQGAPASGVGQTTTMTYDGHGRLESQHVPMQDAGKATFYIYNADDTIQKITDARGALSTFGYNNRRLVTNIDYEAGTSGAPNAADVTYAYDAAGNRTAMWDGAGSTTYDYTALSQLKKETRRFNGLSTSSFPLSYEYNLAGQLKTLTDPFGQSISFSYDVLGRLSGINGAGFPDVSQFVSNIQYRAWGSIKSMTYGNGKTLTIGYDSRLRPASYHLPGVIDKSYQYYDDGRLKYAHDLIDERFDRFHQYDQVGRLTEAHTGTEARGGNVMDGPYRQSYSYNVWGQTTARTSQQWSSGGYEDAAHYTNGRRDSNYWLYDAEGRVTRDNEWQSTYDAAGHRQRTEPSSAAQSAASITTAQFDGDGQRVQTGYQLTSIYQPERRYYLHSSVLGGQVVCEVGANGQKAAGYVYQPGGALLALSGVGQTVWEHVDAAGQSERRTLSGGNYLPTGAEMDITGASMGLEDPAVNQAPYTPPDENSPQFPTYSNPTNAASGCSYNHIQMECSDLMALANVKEGGSWGWVDDWRPLKVSHDDPPDDVVRVYTDIKNGHWKWIRGARQQADVHRERELAATNRAESILDDPHSPCYEFILGLTRRAAQSINRLNSITLDLGGGNSAITYNFGAKDALRAYRRAMSNGMVLTLAERQQRNPNFNIPAQALGQTNYRRIEGGRELDVVSYVFEGVTWREGFYNLGIDDAARQTLHESFHVLDEGFTDQVLANAARSVLGENQRNYPDNEEGKIQASGDLNDRIARQCR